MVEVSTLVKGQLCWVYRLESLTFSLRRLLLTW